MPKKRFRLVKSLFLSIFLCILLSIGSYFFFDRLAEWYILKSAQKIVSLEKQGLLSHEYGYVWSEINLAKRMQSVNNVMVKPDTLFTQADLPDNKKPAIRQDIPSLSAVAELNRIAQTSNAILVTDRNDYPLAEIRTTHTRLSLTEFNPVLLKAILQSEDRHFHTRPLAYEYRAFVRAALVSLFRSITTLSYYPPRGTSTLHQQVAKFLLSRFDAKGRIYSERSIARKIRELKLAQALKMYYPPEALLQVYLNHCVNAGYGLTGYYDISMGLFGKKPADLDICQSLYLARLVKWNRNLPKKIMTQIRIDMPRMAPEFGWDRAKQDSLLTALEKLTFLRPKRIRSDYGPLVDLANEYWLKVCRQNDMSDEEIADMDFSKANTMIRRKGNLKIQLTIDLRLQKKLEQLVKSRGFGADTTLYTDVRVGSAGMEIERTPPPRDTLRIKQRLRADSIFYEAGSRYFVRLSAGDSLITNIRYKKTGTMQYRRSVYCYTRDTLAVPGQYFSYAIMNSKTGELLAYYSRDNIGSRLSSLLRNKTPNGSSIAKPILYALNYDLGHLHSFDMITDSLEIPSPLPWARKFLMNKGTPIGMVYLNTSAPGGYPVSNHNKKFEGYDYAFNHLTESNNILCVEMIYRLNQVEDNLTGAQLYAQIASWVGAKTDTIPDQRGRIPFPADYYSVALGTLELSLYQQMHLFNVLYNNDIIQDPENHPSLVIRHLSITGETVPLTDSLTHISLFSNMDNLKPVKLGLHKRLTSNPADGLTPYDISPDTGLSSDSNASRPLSNFAKSGTTDDIIRPYNEDVATRSRTNYGLWNAVLRVELPRSEYDKPPDTLPELEQLDITLACVGEGNEKKTGARDGKSLHKYVSTGLLHAYGLPVDSGFYRGYEQWLIRTTPDSVRFGNPYETPAIDSTLLRTIIEKSRFLQWNDTLALQKRFFFGLGLTDESYLKLLALTPYFGKNASEYYQCVQGMNEARRVNEFFFAIENLQRIPVQNPTLKRTLENGLKQLQKQF
ncbi:MAG: hypothetical protein A2293_07475 [Elusimicrobia bacterium RIFOXYB2_FULL_49_7]|nr:MAG: hypothetical protein A2293_07475 [Elusimicrobia bacterium RIFOXYB2_FULL_49_7]